MKKLIFILFFFPLLSVAQTKGDNTIVVQTSADFKEVGKKLIEDGYQIADSNADLGTITTEWRDIKFIKYRLVVAVLDNKIQLQAKAINEVVNGVFNTQGSDWLVDFKKGGVENDIWVRMDVFASTFGAERTYVKK